MNSCYWQKLGNVDFTVFVQEGRYHSETTDSLPFLVPYPPIPLFLTEREAQYSLEIYKARQSLILCFFIWKLSLLNSFVLSPKSLCTGLQLCYLHGIVLSGTAFHRVTGMTTIMKRRKGLMFQLISYDQLKLHFSISLDKLNFHELIITIKHQ